jgi:acetylornithine deacetylase/succinyl-diaminopimelate desuccinylase-like protein
MVVAGCCYAGTSTPCGTRGCPKRWSRASGETGSTPAALPQCPLVHWPRTTLAREPFQTPAGASIVEVLRDASRRVTGRSAPVAPLSYWADSAFIAAAAIPTVLYGPAGDGAHADTEWVSLDATRTCASVLVTLAQSFCA